jgi:hypothetical protein
MSAYFPSQPRKVSWYFLVAYWVVTFPDILLIVASPGFTKAVCMDANVFEHNLLVDVLYHWFAYPHEQMKPGSFIF